MTDGLLTPEQVAHHLGVSQKWVNERLLPAHPELSVQVGVRRYVSSAALAGWLEQKARCLRG